LTKLLWNSTASRLETELDPTNANTALTSAFAEELARCGLKLAVVSPGSRSTPLAVALYRQPGIQTVVVLDERSAGFFALGAAAAGGAPVAVLCTSGTAAANFHPAVAEADLSAVPLIVLTADRPPELRDIGAGQTIDQIKLFGAAVRWFSEVGTHDAGDAGLLHMRASACRAWAAAAGEPRPGPVHLNLPFRDPLDPTPVDGAVTACDPLAVAGRADGPMTRVLTAGRLPGPAGIRDVTRLVEAADRVLIVAGRQSDPALRDPVASFAGRLNAPILAEPTSQLRLGPHDRSAVVCGYDRLAAGLLGGDLPSDLDPDLVIRIGETPTSKNLRTWLAGLRDTRQIVIDPLHGWYEPSRTADLIVRAEPAALLGSIEAALSQATPSRSAAPQQATADLHGPGDDPVSGSDERTGGGEALSGGADFTSTYLELWLAADAGAKHGSGGHGASVPGGAITPEGIHCALGDSYRDGDLVYTASSMAIREQESFLPGSDRDVLFFSNRGANGIDGVIASGVGAATATGRPTTIITGELGFQHDLGSLALLDGSPVPVRIVIVNDGGGRIFSRLPQKQSMPADEFETLMSTPGSLGMEAAAALFSQPYRRVTDAGGLEAALRDREPGLTEIVLE
jgi:2-succinyl-5-enolpyruvyl-6-hydroxy-3-cyclohexene-1-carboxylate synthase